MNDEPEVIEIPGLPEKHWSGMWDPTKPVPNRVVRLPLQYPFNARFDLGILVIGTVVFLVLAAYLFGQSIAFFQFYRMGELCAAKRGHLSNSSCGGDAFAFVMAGLVSLFALFLSANKAILAWRFSRTFSSYIIKITAKQFSHFQLSAPVSFADIEDISIVTGKHTYWGFCLKFRTPQAVAFRSLSNSHWTSRQFFVDTEQIFARYPKFDDPDFLLLTDSIRYLIDIVAPRAPLQDDSSNIHEIQADAFVRVLTPLKTNYPQAPL